MPKSRTKVSVPLVAGNGDVFDFDDEHWVVEETTTANHYLTIRRPDDDRVRSFATAADFRDWWAFRDHFGLIKNGSEKWEELGYETKEVSPEQEEVLAAGDES